MWFYNPTAHDIGFLEKLPFLKRAWNNFPIWFTRCHFDFDPITSIFYIAASWGGALRPPVFDLENRCRGGSAELYKGGYLTILEPPPFLFSSRVCLSRQIFLVQAAILTRTTYSRGLSLFAAILNFCMACHAGTARYQFSIRTVHIAWRTPTTRHDFPLSSHDFQQHVMNNMFLFQNLWNFASFCVYFLKGQSTATDKQTT